MRTNVLVLALLVACNGGESRHAEDGSGSTSTPMLDEAPPTAVHSGPIENVAVTDDGSAAYTIDTFGRGRLWLALDGTREPILTRGGRAKRVVLGRTDEGFVVALLDGPGGLELVRLDRDGRTRGHVSLAPDPGFVDVVAVRDGVLVHRRDEWLVWYDAGGRKRGQIAPEPGERIAGIAARRGRVIVALVRGESRRITSRWIELGRTLAWGAPQPLRRELEAPIALSPSGTRLAGIDVATKRFEIVDLTSGKAMYASRRGSSMATGRATAGFLDDHTAVLTDTRGTTWLSLGAKDPWASPRGTPSDLSNVAIGDGVMLDASSTSLTITTASSVKYLGYRAVGPGQLEATGDGVAIEHRGTALWLDRELRARVPTEEEKTIASYNESVETPRHMPPIPDAPIHRATSFHPDGSLFFAASSSELFAYDTSTGEQRWKLALSDVDTLKLSLDESTLFASGRGGLTSIDPRTGMRIATECAWRFGLHDDVSPAVFGVPNLCEALE